MSTTEQKRKHIDACLDACDFKDLFGDCFDRWEFAGSLRRRKPMVADIEHVVIPRWGDKPSSSLFAEPVRVNLLLHRLDELVAAGTLAKHVYPDGGNRWGSKYRGVDFRGFNNEIFSADEQNWGSVLAIRTGPWELSKALVTDLRRRGYCNHEGYVRYLSGETPGAEIVPCPTEEKFFEMAGRKFVAPERREFPGVETGVGS